MMDAVESGAQDHERPSLAHRFERERQGAMASKHVVERFAKLFHRAALSHYRYQRQNFSMRRASVKGPACRPAARRAGRAGARGSVRPEPRPGFSCPPPRSEEHTSELQSLMRISYAVFCLKKKKQDLDNIFVTTNYTSTTKQT